MESPHSNLLPEVDSLPDGFVDGAAEPPLISPQSDEENCLTTNHQTVVVSDDVSIEKAEKPRTFPVPLCEETDGNDDDVDDLIQVSSKLSLEQKEAPIVCQTCERCQLIPPIFYGNLLLCNLTLSLLFAFELVSEGSNEAASTQSMDSLKPKRQVSILMTSLTCFSIPVFAIST